MLFIIRKKKTNWNAVNAVSAAVIAFGTVTLAGLGWMTYFSSNSKTGSTQNITQIAPGGDTINVLVSEGGIINGLKNELLEAPQTQTVTLPASTEVRVSNRLEQEERSEPKSSFQDVAPDPSRPILTAH